MTITRIAAIAVTLYGLELYMRYGQDISNQIKSALALYGV